MSAATAINGSYSRQFDEQDSAAAITEDEHEYMCAQYEYNKPSSAAAAAATPTTVVSIDAELVAEQLHRHTLTLSKSQKSVRHAGSILQVLVHLSIFFYVLLLNTTLSEPIVVLRLTVQLIWIVVCPVMSIQAVHSRRREHAFASLLISWVNSMYMLYMSSVVFYLLLDCPSPSCEEDPKLFVIFCVQVWCYTLISVVHSVYTTGFSVDLNRIAHAQEMRVHLDPRYAHDATFSDRQLVLDSRLLAKSESGRDNNAQRMANQRAQRDE